MDSAHGTAALPAVGFPIRTSPDQSLVSGSPTLFAASPVLFRLLSPRHPSCALWSLVISLPCSSTFSRRPGSSAAPWLTGNPPDDTSCLPTCAYAVVKDRKSWWSRSGSNRRHPACKAGALPAELRPRYFRRGTCSVVGLGRFELPTPRLSSVCSNQLSYRPLPDLCAPGSQRTKRDALGLSKPDSKPTRDCGHRLTCCCPHRRRREKLLRKEVIQPQVPLRLPCYDFTPVTSHSLGAAFPCGLGKPLLEQLTPMV